MALHLAAQHGHEDTVRLFLDRGADIAARAWNKVRPISSSIKSDYSIKSTPSRLATQQGHWNIVQVLSEHEKDNPFSWFNRTKREFPVPTFGSVDTDYAKQ
jgi:ankyrin repeat protein